MLSICQSISMFAPLHRWTVSLTAWTLGYRLYRDSANSLSSASKYHTVIAYRVRCDGCTSCGLRRSDQKNMIRSNFGSMSATVDPCSGNILNRQEIFELTTKWNTKKQQQELTLGHLHSAPNPSVDSNSILRWWHVHHDSDCRRAGCSAIHSVDNMRPLPVWIHNLYVYWSLNENEMDLRPYQSTNLRSFAYFVFA